MTEPLSPEREAEIRAARYTLRTSSPAAADIDIDDLLDELDRVRGELAQAIEHRDHWHAEVRCADARIAELQRPATEAKRGKIQQSYRELAAQAREDRDYEGEAQALHALEAREAQWAAEDEAGAR